MAISKITGKRARQLSLFRLVFRSLLIAILLLGCLVLVVDVPDLGIPIPFPLWLLVICGHLWLVLLLSLLANVVGARDTLPIPEWSELKSIAQNPAFKLSYIALVAIPLVVFAWKAGLSSRFPGLGTVVPLNAKLTYLSAFGFALSNIICGIGDPNPANSDDEAVPEQQEPESTGWLALRWLGYVAFAYGVLFLLIVLFRSAKYVVLA